MEKACLSSNVRTSGRAYPVGGGGRLYIHNCTRNWVVVCSRKTSIPVTVDGFACWYSVRWIGPKHTLLMFIIRTLLPTESECLGLLHALSPLVRFCTSRLNVRILCVLLTHFIFVFLMDLKTISDYFPVQHQVIGLSEHSHTLRKALVSFDLYVRPSVRPCV